MSAPDLDKDLQTFCEGLKVPILPFDEESISSGRYIDEYDGFYQRLK